MPIALTRTRLVNVKAIAKAISVFVLPLQSPHISCPMPEFGDNNGIETRSSGGASAFSPVNQMKPEEFKRVTDVTYLGVVYGTLAALRHMLPRNRGTIVQVGSALAYRSIPLQSAYCAAKHAIAGFTDSLRCELIHDKSKIHLTMVQMPALNTPQFGWVKSRLKHKAKPVPPIFQPEVGARAIYWAAHHGRRELYVGWPTVEAIVANKLVPGALDQYLGRTGFRSQQTSEREDPGRPDNLWNPVPGDHGAHGPFDALAHERSWELRANLDRLWIGAALATVTVAGFFLAFKSDHKNRTADIRRSRRRFRDAA